MEIYYWWTNQFWCITILTNHFWCIFEPHIFRVYYFSRKQEACQEVPCEQEFNEIMSSSHPSYLKTVSQQVVGRIRTHSLRFLTPNTAILVGIIQIHTKFGWLKWLITKNFRIWDSFLVYFNLRTDGITRPEQYKQYTRLSNTWRANNIHLKLKSKIFNSCVKFILLCGSETRFVTSNIMSKLPAFVNCYLR